MRILWFVYMGMKVRRFIMVFMYMKMNTFS